MENIINLITEHGAFMYDPNLWSNEMDENLSNLTKDGLIVNCSDIPHNSDMINPCYTYVANDKEGHALALNHPLFTLVLR